jgi:hypothetical protein
MGILVLLRWYAAPRTYNRLAGAARAALREGSTKERARTAHDVSEHVRIMATARPPDRVAMLSFTHAEALQA